MILFDHYMLNDYFSQNCSDNAPISNGHRDRGAGDRYCPVTVCVCFCVLPSLRPHENPNRSETSVREKQNKRKQPITYASENPTVQKVTRCADERKRGTEKRNGKEERKRNGKEEGKEEHKR